MDDLGYAMNASIGLPYMRAEVIDALRSLSDPVHQRTKWGHYDPVGHYYDDLDINIHILYDDTLVMTDPKKSISHIIYESEVEPLLALNAVLGPLIKDLGDVPDHVYLDDPRWPAVIHAAADALAAMEANEPQDGTRQPQ